MIKNITAIFSLFVFTFYSLFNFIDFNYYSKANANENWTYEDARHLASRLLYSINNEKVKEIYEAGSRANAVNLLMNSVEGPNRSYYDMKMNQITSEEGFSINSSVDMTKYYIGKRIYDPYEVKSKFFNIYEDTFSVFQTNGKDITYMDIENNHQMLYDLSFGSYKEVIKRNMYNNGEVGDYALGQFLDLFNQAAPHRPNENYARELLQLFLMLEYVPTTSKDTGAERNYSEEDVNAFAKIIFGFQMNKNTHEVTYDNTKNTNKLIKFLDGDLKTGDSFDFYNAETGEIDIQKIKTPINGNNGLPDNIIDYIFSKREYEISMFLADKLYRFYINENPTKEELEIISNKIIENDFVMYDTLKWLFVNDLMYSEKAKNSIYYKDPLELTIGTIKNLGLDINDVRHYILPYLSWLPYGSPNIFGRDGYDKNSNFYTAYTQTQWFSELGYMIKSIGDIKNIFGERIEVSNLSGEDIGDEKIINKASNIINLVTDNNNKLDGTLNFGEINLFDKNNSKITFASGSLNFDNISINVSNDSISLNKTFLDNKGKKLIITNGFINGIEVNGTADIIGDFNIYTDFNKENIITFIENKYLNGIKLEDETRSKLSKFLVTDDKGNPVVFDYNDENYRKYYIKSILHFIFCSPEYVLKSGHKVSSYNKEVEKGEKTINNDNKLLIIKARGGLDYLHAVIPKNEYDVYKEYRGSGALTEDEVLDLNDDYYINSKLEPFKKLYDSGNLKIINRVGTPESSRGHDTASNKITSLNNMYEEGDEGIVGHFLKNEDSSKTIVMGNYQPLIFRGGNYINIGRNSYYYLVDETSSSFQNYKKETIKDIFQNRTYPGELDNVYKKSIIIDKVATDSKNAGGEPGSGYSMEENYLFLENIFDTGVASIATMGADRGYDTHGNQRKTLDYNLDVLGKTTYDYFERVKDKQNITIVIFSEFGRANKFNSSDGTDHGQGGGMFIISNNEEFNNGMDKQVYGNLSFKDSLYNWLGVGIDYRSIYVNLFKYIYNKDISNEVGGTFDIENYIDNQGPKIEYFRKEFENQSSYTSNVRIKFNINDSNFKLTESSYITLEYGDDKENLVEQSQYALERYMKISDEYVNLRLFNISPDKKYYYKIKLYDNQYNLTVLEGEFLSPKINTENTISINSDTRLSNFNNRTINRELLLNQDKILLGNNNEETEIIGDNDIKLLTNSGTYIEKITSNSTGAIWNGGFMLPKEINHDFFLDKKRKYNGVEFNDYKVKKLIKVGADSLGIGLTINKEVELKVENLDTSINYGVLTSEDGENWEKISQDKVVKTENGITIKTNHFSYFMLLEADEENELITTIEEEIEEDIPDEPKKVETTSKKGGSPGRNYYRLKDKCFDGDFSPSYYDGDCGEAPDKDLATMSYMNSDIYRQENIEKIEEIKSKAYYDEDILNYENNSEVLDYIDSKIITNEYRGYNIVNINGSKVNSIIEKIVDKILLNKFKNEKNNLLINDLNSLLTHLIIYKNKNLSEIKKDAKENIYKYADSFNTNYSKFKKDKRLNK